MNLFKFIIFFAIIATFVSCSNDILMDDVTNCSESSMASDTDLFDSTYNTTNFSEATKKFIKECIVADENHNLSITISQEEALIIGISATEYAEVLQGVHNANEHRIRFLEEMAKDSTIKSITIVEMSLIEDEIALFAPPIMKSDSEEEHFPSGTLITSNNTTNNTAYLTAPWNMSGIWCNCYGSALGSAHYVATNFLGQTLYAQGIGYTAQFKAPIAASNCGGTITYSTSNSSGGRCVWSGI